MEYQPLRCLPHFINILYFQSHFNDANDYVEIEGENNAASAPVREETDEEDRNRPRFWFIDNID